MTKYTDEFKIKAINMVLAGYSVKHASKLLGIPSNKTLRLWLAHFNHGGIEQLLHKNKAYSLQFKQNVIEYKQRYSLSLRETAALFAIPDYGIIYQWEKAYLTYGTLGLLPKKKGRSSMKNKPEKQRPEPDYIEKLEAENYRLRMENDFLKKYNALVQQEKEEIRKNSHLQSLD